MHIHAHAHTLDPAPTVTDAEALRRPPPGDLRCSLMHRHDVAALFSTPMLNNFLTITFLAYTTGVERGEEGEGEGEAEGEVTRSGGGAMEGGEEWGGNNERGGAMEGGDGEITVRGEVTWMGMGTGR